MKFDCENCVNLKACDPPPGGLSGIVCDEYKKVIE